MGTAEYLARNGVHLRLRNHLPKEAKLIHRAISYFLETPIRLYEYNLQVLPEYTLDELPIWNDYYMPVPVKGKVVLDIGAGCGETAAFYLYHGAKKVIAIEPDPLAFSCLCRNAKRNKMNLHPINEYFSLEHLNMNHDFMKMDCEGGEAELLKHKGDLRPCIIEAHDSKNLKLSELLASKFSLRKIYQFPGQKTSILALT